ncbi:MAG: 2-oxoacid:acceptor oxidoreductase family protein [Candidatus Tectomicrobia bacterium]|uniref:2-oxoacid:acceptor oxidoreductase family protein n=1 Tax=Tectimicrobiota bacterium TaxID=2528274 RepID=A0A933GNB3_UNCTE|nr:2-oxoacid:acceptor oxidoreductase family protein [Candidatus Tectomicrobia bacterium]
MKEFRIHGRGGQGAVMGSKIAGLAASLQGGYALALPFYGFERRGAPVTVFLRFDQKPINLNSRVYNPDGIVVLDSKFLQAPEMVVFGLKEGGLAIFNTKKSPDQIHLSVKLSKIATIDAMEVALQTIGKPITNTAILGAFCKVTGLLELDSLYKALERYLPAANLDKNIEAANLAYHQVNVMEL